jgi:membrane-associated protease RseP (regulator of RpoE activity)
VHPAFPLDKVIGVINVDSVGHLSGGAVNVLGAGTASEWQHIFRGAGFVTGIESRIVPTSLSSSDQVSFVEHGVPAVQITTPPTADYHRPSDTAGTVDVPGLAKVATFAREGVVYLAERDTPLTVTLGPGSTPAAAASTGQGRRASLGTIPDFAYAGPGVKVSGVVAGSPAEAAGLRAGDVVVELAGRAIASLQAYSDVLKTLAPGQATEVVIDRAGTRRTFAVRLGER